LPAALPASRLLVVDDDEGVLVLMSAALVAEHHVVSTARSALAARLALKHERPDLMILDLKLPDGEGADLVAQLQEVAPVPFVIVTGQGDEKVAVEMMKQGALDYVLKDTALINLLPGVIRRALRIVTQQQALAAARVEHERLEREILAASERERQSIGADLHDNLGQQLTALELMCTTLKADAASHPELAQRLAAMGRMLRDAITQTRALARGLVPVGSEPGALQDGLTELAGRIATLGRGTCRLECPKPVLVPDPYVAGHLYRIAQEAVNNAVKHARASRIVIRLMETKSDLTLEIADDGTGMAREERASGRHGMGLGVMQHRARAVGAELTVASTRNGVTVTCRLMKRP